MRQVYDTALQGWVRPRTVLAAGNSPPYPTAMSRRLLLILASILVGMLWASGGCPRSEPKHRGHVERTGAISGIQEQASAPEAYVVVLRGTVIRKPWTKTGESWNAGGSHYYVLDVGDAVISQRSAREGVILRPSDRVAFGDFERFRDQRVAVKGRFVEGKPWTPSEGTVEQHPVSGTHPVTGEVVPLLRGSGFQVFEITRLDEEAP